MRRWSVALAKGVKCPTSRSQIGTVSLRATAKTTAWRWAKKTARKPRVPASGCRTSPVGPLRQIWARFTELCRSSLQKLEPLAVHLDVEREDALRRGTAWWE